MLSRLALIISRRERARRQLLPNSQAAALSQLVHRLLRQATRECSRPTETQLAMMVGAECHWSQFVLLFLGHYSLTSTYTDALVKLDGKADGLVERAFNLVGPQFAKFSCSYWTPAASLKGKCRLWDKTQNLELRPGVLWGLLLEDGKVSLRRRNRLEQDGAPCRYTQARELLGHPDAPLLPRSRNRPGLYKGPAQVKACR